MSIRMPVSRRTAAGAVIVIWVIGLAALSQRQATARDLPNRITEAATRTTPTFSSFVIERDGKQVGYAAAHVDTTATGIEISDFAFIERPSSHNSRVTLSSTATLTRRLRWTKLVVRSDTGDGNRWAVAKALDDSTVVLDLTHDTLRTKRLTLVPSMVPLLVALGTSKPKVGTKAGYQVLDPLAHRVIDVTVAVLAESLFVVSDSAMYDPKINRWREVTTDTIPAWKIEPTPAPIAGSSPMTVWVDAQGQLVYGTAVVAGAGPLTFRREAFDIAYRNWSGRALFKHD